MILVLIIKPCAAAWDIAGTLSAGILAKVAHVILRVATEPMDAAITRTVATFWLQIELMTLPRRPRCTL